MAYRLPLQPVRALIGQDRTLATLLPAARGLRQLNDRLLGALPRAVARTCQVVLVTDGEALILCGNGAAASRVRSQANGLARALSTPDQPVTRIKVRVQADWARPDRPEKPGMARRALAAWDDLEHELPDGELKAAVDRLLEHHRKP